MRIVVATLVVAVLALGAALPAESVTAKTFIELRPDSGPAGSMVHVAGFGFAEGDVRVALAPLDAVEGGFVDDLPETEVVTLGHMTGVTGEDEGVSVTLPGAGGFAWGKQVDILAIQEDPPTSNMRYFVAKATFNLQPTRLADAGAGPHEAGRGLGSWLIAALSATGALLTLAGLRLRATADRA